MIYRDQLVLIHPYMAKRDLQRVLDDVSLTLDQRRRVTILWQMAQALEFLHTPVSGIR